MPNETVIGVRHDRPDGSIPEPGEYGKGADGAWFGCPMHIIDSDGFALVANLSGHEVVEHEDGTITVSPSILVGRLHKNQSWHGYLERGIWREV